MHVDVVFVYGVLGRDSRQTQNEASFSFEERDWTTFFPISYPRSPKRHLCDATGDALINSATSTKLRPSGDAWHLIDKMQMTRT
jgi:hypothetical protein